MKRSHSPARLDLYWISAASFLVFALALAFDLFDRFMRWYVQQKEPFGLEECIPVVLILPIALAVFAWRRWKEQQAAMREIHTLKGILPICASCKRIRDDQGYWHQVEAYVRHHSRAEFSHSACPECADRMRREFLDSGQADDPRP